MGCNYVNRDEFINIYIYIYNVSIKKLHFHCLQPLKTSTGKGQWHFIPAFTHISTRFCFFDRCDVSFRRFWTFQLNIRSLCFLCFSTNGPLGRHFLSSAFVKSPTSQKPANTCGLSAIINGGVKRYSKILN